MLSSIEFASFLVYSPRGTGKVSVQSQQLVRAFKSLGVVGRPPVPVVEHLARRMRQTFHDGALADLLSPDVTLIPVPRSSLPGKAGPWPGEAIAHALVAEGLGFDVVPCLRRVRTVPKAAWAARGDRPDARMHLESLAVDSGRLFPNGVVLVDDVITTGAQMLGAAWALRDSYPDVAVTGFAAIRTMSGEEVEQLVTPVLGTVQLDGNLTRRRP